MVVKLLFGIVVYGYWIELEYWHLMDLNILVLACIVSCIDTLMTLYCVILIGISKYRAWDVVNNHNSTMMKANENKHASIDSKNIKQENQDKDETGNERIENQSYHD